MGAKPTLVDVQRMFGAKTAQAWQLFSAAPFGRGNYIKISYVAIVVLHRETSNQVRMWLGKKMLTPKSEKKNLLNILIGRYIVHFLVTGK